MCQARRTAGADDSTTAAIRRDIYARFIIDLQSAGLFYCARRARLRLAPFHDDAVTSLSAAPAFNAKF